MGTHRGDDGDGGADGGDDDPGRCNDGRTDADETDVGQGGDGAVGRRDGVDRGAIGGARRRLGLSLDVVRVRLESAARHGWRRRRHGRGVARRGTTDRLVERRGGRRLLVDV